MALIFKILGAADWRATETAGVFRLKRGKV
jgi:hypothetical protein